MRLLRFLPLVITLVLIWFLDTSHGILPPLGRFLDPVNGAMTAAESTTKNFSEKISIKGLQQEVFIDLEDRLVPHITANNDHDLYLAQGYIHAYFRLWQMDLQTRAAAGRVSEVAGKKAFSFDQKQRRKGMVYAAERSLKAMEAAPRTKAMLDAYTAGINAFIISLSYRDLPLEYKLMNFEPEPWTNLKCALLLKYMADDLTGASDDISYTFLRDQLGQEQFDFLFPEKIKGSKPVIPEGTKFEAPSLKAPPYPGDSVWAHFGNQRSAVQHNVGTSPLPPFKGGRVGRAQSPSDVGQARNATDATEYAVNTAFINESLVKTLVANDHTPPPPSKGARGDVIAEHTTAPTYDESHIPERSVGRAHSHSDIGSARNFNTHLDDKPSANAHTPPPPSKGAGGDVIAENTTAPTYDESGIGSNNWVIAGSHTASGKPILCNDPHLGLNLPSLWFEVQLTAPGINTYGVSLPGAPGVVIGFNENISWGFTNNYRDVKDYYEITNTGRESYLFNGKQVPFEKRAERILIKDSVEVVDTVLYTIHGPVQYEPTLCPDPMKTGKMLAMCWMAHRPTNELLALYLMNRAKNYEQFTAGIQHFECPAQNFAYADKTGNIAMWGQGQFIDKWRGQGKYVMEGKDSLTLWGQNIPMAENPHVLNPAQGYVASANQSVTDSTYPYWYNGSFVEWRSWRINECITGFSCDQDIFASIEQADSNHTHYNGQRDLRGRSIKHGGKMQLDMLAMQNDVISLLGREEWEILNQFTDSVTFHNLWAQLSNADSTTPHFEFFGDLRARGHLATFFQIFWSTFYKQIWQDDFPNSSVYPSTERTMQLLLSDSTSKYYDDKKTAQAETLRDMVQRAFKETTDSLDKLKNTVGLEWYKVKNTSLTHLAKLPAFSYTQLKTGGWGNTINAMKGNHGPSWRMIVEMDKDIKAYGVYPGGQSGNPGSVHYGDNIAKWVEGKYYDLHFVTPAVPKVAFKYKVVLSPG